MKSIKVVLLLSISLSCSVASIHAQSPMNDAQTLDGKQQSIVVISAFTAKGDIHQLQEALHTGLDAGLTVNDIKEVLVQLYAYAGFPRSLNALNAFMAVLKERKNKNINDPEGKELSPLPRNKSKLQAGTEIQTKLVGRPVKGEVYAFAPAIDRFLKEHLFGDIFGRDNLDWKTRELATISALASLGGVESQLRSHFGVGMHNGLTPGQLHQLVSLIHSRVGEKEGAAAKKVLQNILDHKMDTAATTELTSQKAETLFPKGNQITNNNFTGTAWLQHLTTADTSQSVQVGSVTFEPGARTKWHLHPGGQILLATSGVGLFKSPSRVWPKEHPFGCKRLPTQNTMD